MGWEELPPTLHRPDDGRGQASSGALRLLVIAESGVASQDLPESGSLTIGRSEECDIFIDDPMASREHARLYVTPDRIEIEDLGSANGTRVRGSAIEAGQRIVVSVGHAVDIGSGMLVIQEAAHAAPRRRLWSHGYFEIRVEEECSRSARGRKTTFCLLRVLIEEDVEPGLVQEVLTSACRSSDVLASYAPGEYELLLVDTAKSRAEKVAERIRERLEEAGAEVRVGLAGFPQDGTTSDALIGAAGATVRGVTATEATSQEIIIRDPAMEDLYRMLDRIARGTISVLLAGETGVGKEVVAEAVHRRSHRASKPFIRLNCAAFSETLIESELFGHEKGAFTGADQAKQGLLEAASGGTVFLDEVGELASATQAKLLRVLERREVLRVGSLKPKAIDVRFVSATNRNLEDEVAQGRFRQDLYYRLNGVTVQIPSLRERPAEIEPLARAFTSQIAAQLKTRAPELSDRALNLLTRYSWPGNIRELKNVIERAVLLAEGDLIEPEHLPVDKLSASWSIGPSRRATGSDRRTQILDALEQCAGNQTRAAEILGISRRTLSKWLDRYDIPRPQKSSR